MSWFKKSFCVQETAFQESEKLLRNVYIPDVPADTGLEAVETARSDEETVVPIELEAPLLFDETNEAKADPVAIGLLTFGGQYLHPRVSGG